MTDDAESAAYSIEEIISEAERQGADRNEVADVLERLADEVREGHTELPEHRGQWWQDVQGVEDPLAAPKLTASSVVASADASTGLGQASFSVTPDVVEDLDIDIRVYCEKGDVIFSVEVTHGETRIGTLLELTPAEATDVGEHILRAAEHERNSEEEA
jgi:hypothetical protein